MLFIQNARIPRRLQVATLFLVVMWLFFALYEPWVEIDDDILFNAGSFDDVTDLSGWVREQGEIFWSDDTGYLSLQKSARLRYNLPAFAGDLLNCSGRIRTRGLVPGKLKWDAARILVYFEDANGRVHWSHPHNVGYLSGDSDWRLFSARIEVPAYARKGWVELAHFGREGVAEFDDIKVVPAIWKPAYPHWQMFFGMLWASMMMLLVLNTHFWTIAWGKAVLFCGVMIIVGVTLPPSVMFQVANSGAKISKTVLNQAEEVFQKHRDNDRENRGTRQQQTVSVMKTQGKTGKQTALPQPATHAESVFSARFVQKTGHSILFSLLGFFVFLAFFPGKRNFVMLYSLFLFAFATEVLQLVVDGRLFGAGDLLLDLAGILAGVMGGWGWLHVRQRRRLL